MVAPVSWMPPDSDEHKLFKNDQDNKNLTVMETATVEIAKDKKTVTETEERKTSVNYLDKERETATKTVLSSV